jgi:hypothetical protein
MTKISKSVPFIALSMLAVGPAAEKSAMAALYNTSAPAVVNQISANRSPTDVWGNASWFTLKGVTSLGTCGTQNGLVAFKIQDADKFLQSTVTAAFLSGKKLTVYVDDGAANKENGFCFAQSVLLQ